MQKLGNLFSDNLGVQSAIFNPLYTYLLNTMQVENRKIQTFSETITLLALFVYIQQASRFVRKHLHR